MKTSVDISLYPLNENYIPAIDDFIARVSNYEWVEVTKNDLSTQIFGEFNTVMEILTNELRHSWETHGSGVFVIKFLMGDLQGLAS